MSFVRAAAAIAAKDLRVEGRTRATLASAGLFALVVLVVFAFAFDLDTVRRLGAPRVIPGILWVTLSFAGIVGFARSFAIERESEAGLALALAPVDRGAIFAGKALANGLLLAALEVVLIPLLVVFFDVPLAGRAGGLALVLALHTAGLALLGTLFGAVASRVGRGEALVATLLLPAATPLLLSAVHCTSGAIAGTPLADDARWLLVTAGFDVLYSLVGLLVFDAVVEEG